MSCRDIHATTAFAFVIAVLSVIGLAVATVVPQWRTTRLLTFNLNAKNVTVYDGLWTKCVRRDGSAGCYYFDAEWYSKVDQLDVRLLQFCLPTGLFFAGLALLISLTGMCKTACCSKAPDDVKLNRCLVNSSGCHLVAGMFLLLAGAIAMPPSVWFLFHTRVLNTRYSDIFATEFAAYVAIGSAGGLELAALLMFMWYCMCKKLPSPFWLPLDEAAVMSSSMSAQPLMTLPSPVTYVPHSFPPAVLDAPAFVPLQGYPPSMPGPPMPPQVYMAQMSAANGYGSEVGVSQAYGYTPSHSYAPSQSYAPSLSHAPSQRYTGHRYSSRSRLSAIEIDIPLLTE